MRKTFFSLAALLCLAAPSSAKQLSFIFRAATVTVLTVPTKKEVRAVVYENPDGLYIVSGRDLKKLNTTGHKRDGVDLYRFEPTGIAKRRGSDPRAFFMPYDQPGAADWMRSIIAVLVKTKGKKTASAELAARIEKIKKDSRGLKVRLNAAGIAVRSGMLKGVDIADINRLDAERALAGKMGLEIAAVRDEVEPDLDKMIDPQYMTAGDPRMKAAFYGMTDYRLTPPEETLERVERELDSLLKK